MTTTMARRILTSRWLALGFRLYLGGLFVYASMYKIQYPGEFAESVAAYQLVPHFLLHVMAVFMPWVELVSGILLIAGVRAKAAALSIGAMLVMFTLALVYVLVADIPIGCGCFTAQEAEATWLTVGRDLAWLTMVTHVFFYDRAFHLDNLYSWKLEDLQQ